MITAAQLHALRAAAARAARSGATVAEAALEDLMAREAAGTAVVRSARNELSRTLNLLWACVWSDETKRASRLRGVYAVQSIDFTHTTSQSALQLGASVGFCVDAGAFPIPLVFFVYLAGGRVENEMTDVRGLFGLGAPTLAHS